MINVSVKQRQYFDEAIETVLHHEGHISDDPDDPGGFTVFGISLRTAVRLGDLDGDGHPDLDFDGDGDVDRDDLASMTVLQARDVYRKAFWLQVYERMPTAALAVKSFDLAVNMGPRPAHRNLQRAIRAASDLRVVDDGIIGPKTLAAVRKCDPAVLLAAYKSEAAGFYRALVVDSPVSRKYLGGWLNRAYS